MNAHQDTGSTAGNKRDGHRWFAAFYDRMCGDGEGGRLGRDRAALIGPLRGRVLEIGAGTGVNFRLYHPSAQVTATEPDPHMCKRAVARLARLGRTNIELRQAGAEDLPFPDGSFDHAVSTLVLCTVRDPARALGEIRRALSPDGRFHFIEHVRAESLFGGAQDAIRPVWSHFSGGCTVNRRTESAILQAGFTFERLERTRMHGLPHIVGVARPA